MLKIDAVSQMRVEYQNAIVHQARVQQAQRIREVQKNENDLEDAVKSAMCPFLVLEVRRDRLIEDTLNQIHLKVRKKVSSLCSFSPAVLIGVGGDVNRFPHFAAQRPHLIILPISEGWKTEAL